MASKTIPIKPLTSWSYSRLQTYKLCPRQFKHRFIDKLPEPESPALKKGNKVHQEAEDYLNGNIKKIPSSLALFRKEFKALLKLEASAEEQWTINDNWEETGWFDRDAWCRMKIDAYYIVEDGVMKIIDFKTGKVRDSYDEQLSFYSLIAFCLFEGLEKVEVELWFLDHHHIETGFYTFNSHFKKLKNKFLKDIKPMFNDKEFVPKPSWLCKFCHFSHHKGGPCEY